MSRYEAVGPRFEDLSDEEMAFVVGGNTAAEPYATPATITTFSPETPYITTVISAATATLSLGIISVNQGCGV